MMTCIFGQTVEVSSVRAVITGNGVSIHVRQVFERVLSIQAIAFRRRLEADATERFRGDADHMMDMVASLKKNESSRSRGDSSWQIR